MSEPNILTLDRSRQPDADPSWAALQEGRPVHGNIATERQVVDGDQVAGYRPVDLKRSAQATQIHAIPMGFDTCYVLVADGVVAIDAGQPNRAHAFLAGLERASIRPEDVGLVLLTHGHWDHMGSAADLRALTAAPLAIHETEAEWVERGDPPLPPGITPWGRIFIAVHGLVKPFIKTPPATVDRRLSDEVMSLEEFGIPGVVVPTPGHSPGSVSVVLKSGEAFVGDLAMNRLPLTARPSLSIFGDDPDALQTSWDRVLELGAEKIYPAHGQPFLAAEIRRRRMI